MQQLVQQALYPVVPCGTLPSRGALLPTANNVRGCNERVTLRSAKLRYAVSCCAALWPGGAGLADPRRRLTAAPARQSPLKELV